MKITICELSTLVGYNGNYQQEADGVDYGGLGPVYFYDKEDAYSRLRKAAAFFAKDYAPDDSLPREIGSVRVFLAEIPDGTPLPEDPSALFIDFFDGEDIEPIIHLDALWEFPEIESATAYENGEVVID